MTLKNKDKKEAPFEHKDFEEGSVRVWKNKIFYEDAGVPRMLINDGVSTALVIESACTMELRAILNRHGISFDPAEKESRRLRQSIPGLDFDGIRTMKSDKELLRIKYKASNIPDLIETLENATNWLESNGIPFGEADGAKFCIRPGCFSVDELKELMKDHQIE